MSFTKNFNYLIRRYPVIRAALCVAVIAAILGAIYIFKDKTKLIPEIYTIVPPVGTPGDIIVINGKNFGNTRDMSYVEFSGVKLTASSYITWRDDYIKLVLPANIQDGLVVVGTRTERSKPALFANDIDIPVPVPTMRQSSKPFISSISNEKVNTGDLITIYGKNFGESKDQSKVLFTIDFNNKIHDSEFKNNALYTENMIAANEADFDYVYWSDSEIQVRIPDGACSGVIVVDSGKEKSEPKSITINENAGKKSYLNKKIYLMEYSVDIAEVFTNDIATITLRCPIPSVYASQPNLEITEVNPEPLLTNYQNNLIHQVTRAKTYLPKTIFTQTFVLPVYEINTNIEAEKTGNYKDTEKNLLSKACSSDALIPSDNSKIVELSQSIVGKEKNAYKKAKLIYDYMRNTYKITELKKNSESDPLLLLKDKKGDAYDFAIIYTALMRAAEIPTLTDAGILVQPDLYTQNHWWCEFYLDKFGWVPVDIALGAGLPYKKWSDVSFEDESIYYFGNLDSHHICFSRGWNVLKPFSQDSKIVKQPRRFALQPIWEESSSNTIKYSSYWSNPIIKGIY